MSSMLSTAWLPIEIMWVSGTDRSAMVRSDESIPLCVTMAAPARARLSPWAKGQSATRSRKFSTP